MPDEPLPTAEHGTATQLPQHGIVNPPANSPQPDATTETPPTAEEIAQLRQQAQASQKLAEENRQLQDRYGNLQGAYTQTRQQIAALTGAQQPAAAPQDPLAKYVQPLVAKGYSEKDARAMAETQFAMMQDHLTPLQQQFTQSVQALQGQTQVDTIMRDAWGKHPQLFSDPVIQQQTEQALRTMAQQGGQISPDLAIDTAAIFAFRKTLGQPPGQPQQAPPMQPQIYANGMNGIRPGFPPVAQPQSQSLSAEQQAADTLIKSRFNIK